MAITAFQGAVLFRDQIARRTGLKTLLMPGVMKEAGPVVKVSVRKAVCVLPTKGGPARRTLRLTVAVEGVVESETGLKLCLEAVETLSAYLETSRRLEDEVGDQIPDSLVLTKVNEDDGILEDPETGAKAWVRDEFFVDITLP